MLGELSLAYPNLSSDHKHHNVMPVPMPRLVKSMVLPLHELLLLQSLSTRSHASISLLQQLAVLVVQRVPSQALGVFSEMLLIHLTKQPPGLHKSSLSRPSITHAGGINSSACSPSVQNVYPRSNPRRTIPLLKLRLRNSLLPRPRPSLPRLALPARSRLFPRRLPFSFFPTLPPPSQIP